MNYKLICELYGLLAFDYVTLTCNLKLRLCFVVEFDCCGASETL